MMKLFHGSMLIGTIEGAESSGAWMVGTVQLTPIAEPYRELFDYMTKENKSDDDVCPFPGSIYEDWFIEDEQGVLRESLCPSVYSDGEIHWRW